MAGEAVVPEVPCPPPTEAPVAGPVRRSRRLRRWLAVGLLLALIGAAMGLVGLQFWASYHRRAGRAALERYHSRQAYEHLLKCLRVWPRDPAALLLAARATRRLGDFDEAEHYLERYQNVRGKDDDLMLEQILLRAERGDVDAVRTYCRTLIDQDHPATPLVLEALARGSLRMLRLKDAEAVIRLWLNKEPDNPLALWLQGTVLQDRDKLSDAVACYRRVVQLDSEYDEARLRLCSLLIDLGQGQEALPHLEYLARRRPDSPKVRVALARCQDLLGREADADATLAGVLRRWPLEAQALVERGQLALRAGRLEDAEVWLWKGCELGPSDPRALYHLHQCLVRRGKKDEAAAVLVKMKQAEEDLRRLNEILTRDMGRAPHSASLHCEVGAILLRGGAAEEGLRWLRQALALNPRHRLTHQTLADYYQRVGELGNAARHRALAEPPGRDEGRGTRGEGRN